MKAVKRAAAQLARACAPAFLLFALLLSGCGETSCSATRFLRIWDRINEKKRHVS